MRQGPEQGVPHGCIVVRLHAVVDMAFPQPRYSINNRLRLLQATHGKGQNCHQLFPLLLEITGE